MKAALTESIQDYPRAVYLLGEAGDRVTVSALAKRLHVDAVHDEADKLEHVLSEELEERIDRALGFPTHDPHGDPIPNRNLEWPGTTATSTRARRRV